MHEFRFVLPRIFVQMKLYAINTGHFRLDGGAMFGVVPKTLWNKLNPADENNLCSWAMRSLLVEAEGRLVLIDTGIGNKQDAKFFGHYGLHGADTLDKSLARYGFHRNDITDVFLTHLHFDHCGGSFEWNASKDGFRPAFANARFWSNEKHWQHAVHPNVREKASFLSENILPIRESGQLHFLNEGDDLFPGFSVYWANGHTESQMIPVIDYKDTQVIFCADVAPSAAHIRPSWVMAYDIRPLDSMKEREFIMNRAAEKKQILFFEHDPVNECAMLKMTDKGPAVDRLFPLDEL
jgi:glyoxylase-like metal-dependent hydrolase (beta-lactamase superfamily II)